MTLSNSQPAVTVRPPSFTSSLTVAASGMIQPVSIASRNGMQRFTVSPLSVADTAVGSTAGSRLNQSGIAVLDGAGGAITP